MLILWVCVDLLTTRGVLIYPLLQVVPNQPKTLSGKVVRYQLRQIASEMEGSDGSRYTHLAGDTTTKDYLYTYEDLKVVKECTDYSVMVH